MLGETIGDAMTATPRPPSVLGDAGRRLWRHLARWLDEQEAELEPHERLLAVELCVSADRLATIRDALGRLDPSAAAWSRLASEERQRGLAMARLVSSIGFPTGLADVDGRGDTPRSRRARTAAQARWEASASVRRLREAR